MNVSVDSAQTLPAIARSVHLPPHLPGETLADAGGLVAIPDYLQQVYWWAYVHPQAVRAFEREWLVNLILFGNYARLRDAALEAIGPAASGRILQIACVYGDLTQRLSERIAGDGSLDVVDVLPIQLANIRQKLPSSAKVSLWQRNSTALGFADASYDCILLFFLLHEQPDAVRRQTLAEAFRTVKPGGKIVIVDYHGPAFWHPLRIPVRAILSRLEPFALDLWRDELAHYFPTGIEPAKMSKQTSFGGLYQQLVLVR